MRQGLVFRSLAIPLLAFPALAFSARPDSQDTRFTADPKGIYDRTCGYCHGHNVGPVLLGRGLPPALTRIMVRNGIGAMPAFRHSEITDEQLEELVAWIEQSEPRKGDFGR